MKQLRSLQQLADTLRARHADLRARSVPLRGRVDFALFAALAVGVLAFGTFGWTLARIEDARGFLDPPEFEEIEDRRILTDYRDPSAPIVDMVAQGVNAFAGRSDGTIHRYNMETGLFTEESLPGSPSLSGPLSFLSSNCTATGDCPDDAAIFAVTETGGLARRDGNGWQTVISDNAWIGADGAPVELSQVKLWAVSDDGRWLLASAGSQGLGLFDQRTSVWVSVAQNSSLNDPAHINFAHGRFWLGGPGGMETIDPRRPTARSVVPGFDTVVDLEKTAGGDLLILHSQSCTGGSCLSISQAYGASDIRRLVGETAISPRLSSTNLSHVAMQDGNAVVLGDAGVHVYDPNVRSWTVLEASSVDAFHAGPKGQSILFAAGLKVARIRGGRIVWNSQTPERVQQILPISGGGVLALLKSGAIVDLSGPEAEVIVPADAGPGAQTQVLTGAAVRGTVVLRRGADLILHDPAARRWSVAAKTVPPEAGPNSRLLGTDRALWLVDFERGLVWDGTVTGSWPAKSVSFQAVPTYLDRLVSAQADGINLHLVQKDGLPVLLRSGGGGKIVRVGAPAPRGFLPITATTSARSMIFSDGKEIAAYDTENRGWSDAWRGPPGGVKDIGIGLGTTLALSPSGVLYGEQEDAWATLSGSPDGIALGSAQLTDAVQAAGSVFLGGAGRIVEYQPDARRSVRVFGQRGSAVRIVDVVNGEPVWTSGGKLFQGDRRISDTGETVIWAGRSADEFMYVADENGRRFLVRPGKTPRCLFRGDAPPKGAPVDARELPDGRIFVVTTTGIAIYEPVNRRWVGLTGAGVSANARLEIVAEHLVLLEQSKTRVLPLSAIPQTDSCEAGPAEVSWSVLPRSSQIVHDARGDRLLLLNSDGGVREWRGWLSTILPAEGIAPATATLRRVLATADGLVFASEDQIWTYNGKARTWSSRAIVGGPASVGSVDITLDGGVTRVTLWDKGGQGFGGEAQAGPIKVRPLVGLALPRPDQDPAEILDMAQDKEVLAVLGERVLELFNRTNPSLRATIRLPEAQTGWQIHKVAGTEALVLSDGSQDRPERLFVLDTNSAMKSKEADLAQVSFGYEPRDDRDWQITSDALWRIDQNVVLHRCEITNGLSAPDACTVQTKTPDILDPETLSAATILPSGDRLVLAGGNVLRIDGNWRISNRIELPDLTAHAQFAELGRARYLWAGQGGALWRMSETNPPEKVLSVVLDLRNQAGFLVATTPEGLFLIEDEAEPKAPKAGSIPLVAATLDAQGNVRGLGPDGLLRSHGSTETPRSDIVFPEDSIAVLEGPEPTDIELYSPGAFWAQHSDGQIRVHFWGFCQPPEIEPIVQENQPGDQTEVETVEPNQSGDVLDPSESTDQAPASDSNEASGVNSAESEVATEAEIEPLPEPEPVPCVQLLDTGLALEDTERMLFVRAQDEGFEVTTTQANYSLAIGERSVQRISDRDPAIVGSLRALNDIRNNIYVVDGKPLLAPPRFQVSNELFYVDTGTGVLKTQLGGRLTETAPLSLSSLQWDRAEKAVKFNDGTILPSVEAIRDGRFLPDAKGRTAYLGGDEFALLNPHGLWRVRIGGGANPVNISEFDLPIDLAKGRFLYGSNGIDARTAEQVSDFDSVSVSLGALRLTETLRGGKLTATYSVDGLDVPAFARNGFSFDDRLGITSKDGAALLLTPIGLVPATGLGSGISVPNATAAVDTEGTDALARSSSGWFRHTAQGWVASSPPWNDRVLAVGQGRRWERMAGNFRIVAASTTQKYTAARRGLEFEADRLISLAANSDGIVAVLGIGTINATNFAGLAALTPPVAADPGAKWLDSEEVSPGRSVLWANTGQGQLVWDFGTRSWRAAKAGEDPWAFRTSVDTGSLRIAFRSNAPVISVRTEDLNGGTRFQEFSWTAGRDMPFDRGNGFFVEGDRILLATEMGLRSLNFSIGGRSQNDLYSGVVSGTPLAFKRVGRPFNAPDRLLATAGNSCFEFPSPGAAPVPCATQGSLAERGIPSDSLWAWYKTDTQLVGSYRDFQGQALGSVQLGKARRWPHDSLRSVTQCRGTVVEVWADADVVARAGTRLPDRLEILPGIETILCQAKTAQLGKGARLDAGLLAAGGGKAWRYTPQGWQPENHYSSIIERARGAVPWEASRLRIRIVAGRMELEIRSLSDEWRPISWIGDRPSLDRVIGIAGTGPTLRLLTPDGVLDWPSSGRRLDPDKLILRTPDDYRAWANCGVAQIEALDGSVQAVPAQQGSLVDIVCEDGQAWRGNPSATVDIGAFSRAVSDIGADRVLVEENDWLWTRRVSSNGATSLSISYRNEDISLDGGRLSLDDYAGLAAPYDDQVEIVTHSMGWWRYPRRDLSMTAGRRPPPGAGAQTATSLHSDNVDGAPRLCVEGQNAVFVDDSGDITRSPGCRDVRGSDSVYVWYSGEEGAAANGVALNGLPILRDLSEGRFNDLFVTGAPIEDLSGDLFAPTKAGVIQIGPSGPEGTYAMPDWVFVAPDQSGRPLALGTSGPFALSGGDLPGCAALVDLATRLPEGTTVLKSFAVSQDSVIAIISNESGERLPLLVPCSSVEDTLVWSIPLNVVKRSRYRAIGGNTLTPSLLAAMNDTQLSISDMNGIGVTLEPRLESQPVAMAVAPDGSSTVIATDHSLYRMDTDRILTIISRSGGNSVTSPKGPFAASVQLDETVSEEPIMPPVTTDAETVEEVEEISAAPVVLPDTPSSNDKKQFDLSSSPWRDVQRALSGLGLYNGEIDGIAGPLTRSGIRAWQTQSDQPATSELTEQQLNELLGR